MQIWGLLGTGQLALSLIRHYLARFELLEEAFNLDFDDSSFAKNQKGSLCCMPTFVKIIYHKVWPVWIWFLIRIFSNWKEMIIFKENTNKMSVFKEKQIVSTQV